MEKINREELIFLYQKEVDESKDKYNDLVLNTEFSEKKYSPDVVDAIEWSEGFNKTLDNFDNFIDNNIKHEKLCNTLKGYQSKDKYMRKITHDNLYKLGNANIKNSHKGKRMDKIRKIMYDDAKQIVNRELFEYVDLDNAEKLKEVWLDAKIQVRNDMTILLNDIAKLNEIERLIQCRNNLN